MERNNFASSGHLHNNENTNTSNLIHLSRLPKQQEHPPIKIDKRNRPNSHWEPTKSAMEIEKPKVPLTNTY